MLILMTSIFFFFRYFICLNFASFLLVAFSFSILLFMMRVQRFNARKDCLVCITGVIAGGHYDQGRDTECKAYYYDFYIQQFACAFDLPDCISALILLMVMPLLLMIMNKCLHSFTWIMMMITILTKCRQLPMRLVIFMV